MSWQKTGALFALMSALLLCLPLLGVRLTGQPIWSYLEFPPRTRFVEHAQFSWPAFGLLALEVVIVIWVLIWLATRPRLDTESGAGRLSRLPWWGVLAAVSLGVFWLLAWSRFNWFGLLQSHTFTPIWFSYIVLINACTYRRSGHCLLTDRTGYFLILFPLSTLFWWYFEFLNRFVQNWYYVGIVELSAWRYALQASISFSIVLPAVMSTLEYLYTFPVLAARRAGPPLDLVHHPMWAGSGLIVACAGLLSIALWPNLVYSLVWVAPLLLLLALQRFAGVKSYLIPLQTGDYRIVYLPALAALCCGVLWEMWNFYSQSKWEYAIPYVHRFELFEMPVLGYAGYLPFGLICAVVAEWLADSLNRSHHDESKH